VLKKTAMIALLVGAGVSPAAWPQDDLDSDDDEMLVSDELSGDEDEADGADEGFDEEDTLGESADEADAAARRCLWPA